MLNVLHFHFLRASQTSPPNSSTAPGSAPSSTQRISRCWSRVICQPEIRDGSRPDAFQQLGPVEQPVDGVAEKIAVAAAFNVMIAEKNGIARDKDARGAARVGNAGSGFLLDGGDERITARRRGGIARERGVRRWKRRVPSPAARWPEDFSNPSRPTRPGQNHLEREIVVGERIHHRMLAEFEDADVLSRHGRVLRVLHVIGGDVHAPALQNGFQAGRAV